MLFKGYINQLCGETLADLRMVVLSPTAKFNGLKVTLTKTQRKAAINAPYQSRQDARKLEDWLEMHPHRFVLLGINPDLYNLLLCGLRHSFLNPRIAGGSIVSNMLPFHTRSTL
jgi:hypothetical protein